VDWRQLLRIKIFMKKYKIKPFDEVHDMYLLYRQVWWIFYSFVSAGTKEALKQFVKDKDGIVINL
jgi:hypothetical protein